jgi:hypothetical protein
VSDDVGDRGRQQQRLRDHGHAAEDQQAAGVAPPGDIVAAAGRPEGPRAEPEEPQAGRDREYPGVVVARGPDRAGVVRGLGTEEDAEESAEERNRGPRSGTEAGIEDDCDGEQGERHEAAEQVAGSRGAWIRLQEPVVEDVQGHGAEPDPREARLGANGGRRGGEK